jgi:hypothetical protein
MKRLCSILVYTLISVFAIAQESESDNTPTGDHKYFISTNSGLLNTPIGFRVGVLNKKGCYIGTRFGKGYKYEDDAFSPAMKVTEATLFSATAGLILPISIRNNFKVHTYLGIGYGKWFDRPSKNGQTVGGEFEGGLILSYQKLMINLGGNVLAGDGNSPKGDLTLGVGFRF